LYGPYGILKEIVDTIKIMYIDTSTKVIT